MNYKLAALKVLVQQLKEAREIPSQKASSLGGILFQRAWLQGLLVSRDANADDCFILDDGTGLLRLSLSADTRLGSWTVGMYVMVVGAYIARTDDLPLIKVHKMVDLSAFPDREAMWYLEVVEAYKLFYQPLIDEFV